MRYTKNDIINVFNEWYSIYFNIQKVYVSVSDYATKPEMNYMLKLVVLLEHMETHYEALARKKYPKPKSRGSEYAEHLYNTSKFLASKYLYVYNKIIVPNTTFAKLYKKYLEYEKIKCLMKDFENDNKA